MGAETPPLLEYLEKKGIFLKDLVVLFPEDDESIQMITTALNLAIVDDDEKLIIKDLVLRKLYYRAFSLLYSNPVGLRSHDLL
jgi:hypothetical protein